MQAPSECHSTSRAPRVVLAGFARGGTSILFGLLQRLFVDSGLRYCDLAESLYRQARTITAATDDDIVDAMAGAELVGCFRDIPDALLRVDPASYEAVVIVRDPRDCLLSWYHGRHLHVNDPFSTFSRDGSFDEFVAASEEFVRAQERVADFATTAGALLITYETLVTRPAAVIRSILEHIGVSFDRNAVDAMLVHANFIRLVTATHEHNRCGAPYQALSTAESAVLDTLTVATRPLLEKLGYPLAGLVPRYDAEMLGQRAEIDGMKRFMLVLAQQNHLRIEENAALRREIERLTEAQRPAAPEPVAASSIMARIDVGALRLAVGFSTKERPEFTIQTIGTLDVHPAVDVLWLDGSDRGTARRLPSPDLLTVARLKEIHFDVKGGPDAAIQYALRRMLELGYDYIGLLENDVVLEPGWLPGLLNAIDAAERDGFVVGAATVRTIASRCLFHRASYAAMWNMGAGMALFTRAGAQAVLEDYHTTGSQEVGSFWQSLGFELEAWELWMDRPDRALGADWWFAAAMMKRGLASVGALPSLAHNIDFDLADYRTSYAKASAGDDPAHAGRYQLLQSHCGAP